MLPEGFVQTGSENIGIKYVASKKVMEVFYLRSAKKRYGVVYLYADVPESETGKIMNMGAGAKEYLAKEFQDKYKLTGNGMLNI